MFTSVALAIPLGQLVATRTRSLPYFDLKVKVLVAGFWWFLGAQDEESVYHDEDDDGVLDGEEDVHVTHDVKEEDQDDAHD